MRRGTVRFETPPESFGASPPSGTVDQRRRSLPALAFRVGPKAQARSAAVREFYPGRLESTSERSNGRTVRSQSARSGFETLYGWQRYP